jgi:hypothetical protein
MHTVAVQDGLDPVRNALLAEGYHIVDLRHVNNADLVVLNGINENLMGIADTSTKAPVITANGLTPTQVVNEVRDHLRNIDTGESMT